MAVVSVTDLQGRKFTLLEPYLVGREHVRTFARAVFATNPVHFDVQAAKDAGYRDVVAPATYPAVLQDRALELLLSDGGTVIERKQVLHADERFTYTRPIVAGDELSAELEVTSVRLVRGNAILQAATNVTDAAGEPVVTATATLLIGGAA